MSLTKEELKTLRLFISEELRAQLQPFRDDVNRRFDEVNQRFEQVYQRFDEVDRRFDEVNQRFAEVNQRFGEVATQIDGLYLRDEKREQEYLFIREQIQRLEAKTA